MQSIVPETVHVAVAVITNGNDEVLISLRPKHVHQGDLWEFPGGKVEQDETVETALRREIKEELDIEIGHMSSFIQITHHYADKSVLLDVWRIHSFSGKPHGVENQPIRWSKIDQLDPSVFPQANQAIIKALNFPDQLLITGEAKDNHDFINKLKKALLKGIRIVQLRYKGNDRSAFISLVKQAQKACEDYDTKLLINTDLDLFTHLNSDGLHLNSQRLFLYGSRPVSRDKILSVSCHNEHEILQANRLNADIVLLSPVKPTTSHPGAPGLGWSKFSQIASKSHCPVYALGGMEPGDIKDARYYGAQGIAAISCFWSDE